MKKLCRGGRYYNFLLKEFCFNQRKFFLFEPYLFQKDFLSEVFCIGSEGGGGSIQLSIEQFFSDSTKKFVGEPYGVSEKLKYQIIFALESDTKFSVGTFLSHFTVYFQ